MIQIEAINAVGNIDELLKYDKVDGIMAGPYDISGSLKVPGQIDHPLVQEPGKHVIESCKKFGKACRTQDINPTHESVEQALENGYPFEVLASDIFFSVSGVKNSETS